MQYRWLAGPLLTFLAVGMPAWGASDGRIENLALCRDSWLDWKNTDPSALDSFVAFVRSAFVHNDNDGSFTPKSPMTVEGLKITQVFPESLGMGVGFSVLVDASFDDARLALKRDLGKSLHDCQASEGMRTCELSVADQRTIVLASSDSQNDKSTLIGCYYLYEK